MISEWQDLFSGSRIPYFDTYRNEETRHNRGDTNEHLFSHLVMTKPLEEMILETESRDYSSQG